MNKGEALRIAIARVRAYSIERGDPFKSMILAVCDAAQSTCPLPRDTIVMWRERGDADWFVSDHAMTAPDAIEFEKNKRGPLGYETHTYRVPA